MSFLEEIIISKRDQLFSDLKSVLKEEVDQIKKVHANLPPFLEQAIQIKDDYVTVQSTFFLFTSFLELLIFPIILAFL